MTVYSEFLVCLVSVMVILCAVVLMSVMSKLSRGVTKEPA